MLDYLLLGKVPNSNRRSVNIGRFGRETGKRIASYDDALLPLCFRISLDMLLGLMKFELMKLAYK